MTKAPTKASPNANPKTQKVASGIIRVQETTCRHRWRKKQTGKNTAVLVCRICGEKASLRT
jgi:hypothetical protein